MTEVLLFIEEYQTWIYLALAVAILVYLRVTWRWYRARRATIFSLEREHATAHLTRSATLLGLALVLLVGTFAATTYLGPAVPASERPTPLPTVSLLATSTFVPQNFFRMYRKLAGMTGTSETEAGEFWEIYKLDVAVIPTNQPVCREDHEDVVFRTKKEKYTAIIDEIVEAHERNQPVLVGTVSVEVSELLSRMLKRRGVKHNVLNAKYHQQEAEIVSQAGQPGAVTIATNMAGRGTDIKLGQGVAALGGLRIIGTERHESRRIDRQLRGRM